MTVKELEEELREIEKQISIATDSKLRTLVKAKNELKDLIEIVSIKEEKTLQELKKERAIEVEADRIATTNKRHSILLKAFEVLREAIEKVNEIEKELELQENLYKCRENSYLERSVFNDVRIEKIKIEVNRVG